MPLNNNVVELGVGAWVEVVSGGGSFWEQTLLAFT